MDLGSLFGITRRPYCVPCEETSGAKYRMDPTTTYDPSQNVYVEVWECPECGRQVYRDEGDGVTMITPDGERF